MDFRYKCHIKEGRLCNILFFKGYFYNQSCCTTDFSATFDSVLPRGRQRTYCYLTASAGNFIN